MTFFTDRAEYQQLGIKVPPSSECIKANKLVGQRISRKNKVTFQDYWLASLSRRHCFLAR